jgi:hypothetical protein
MAFISTKLIEKIGISKSIKIEELSIKNFNEEILKSIEVSLY